MAEENEPDRERWDMSKLRESLMSTDSHFLSYKHELNVNANEIRTYDLPNVFQTSTSTNQQDEEIDSDDCESVNDEIFNSHDKLVSENVIETLLPLQRNLNFREQLTNDNFYKVVNFLTPENTRKDLELETETLLECAKRLNFDIDYLSDDEKNKNDKMKLRPRRKVKPAERFSDKKDKKKKLKRALIGDLKEINNEKKFQIGNGNNQIKNSNGSGFIGIYSPLKRKELIENYLVKRKKRVWKKRIKYEVRKNFADSRLRVKGRFISKKDEDILREALLMAF